MSQAKEIKKKNRRSPARQYPTLHCFSDAASCVLWCTHEYFLSHNSNDFDSGPEPCPVGMTLVAARMFALWRFKRRQGFVETRRLTVKEGARFVGDAKVTWSIFVCVYGCLPRT